MNNSKEPVYFLLVDDLEENLLSLEALLTGEGLVCLKAKSGVEALELLLKHDFALVLLDVMMPEMDGFELAEAMRGMERTRNVPIIFLTAGNADRQRRFRGYEAGAVDFLQKPIDADIMRSKADVFFRLYRQQQQLAHQRDELQQYADALKETDRRKDIFLATLAHELRNPLAPLRNGLQILRMSPSQETAQEVKGMMERQLAHMVRLIEDLMDVSRVSQGKIELRKQRITLQEAISDALEASRSHIDAKGHTFTLNVPETPIWLDADLTRLAQILNNLLNNAAKYTPENGHIELSVRVEGKAALVMVKDNGLGMEKESLSKVFELFSQIDEHRGHAEGGLGIGLSLVKNLVELHHGSIRVESAGKGKGSVFIVSIPLAETTEVHAIEPVVEETTASPLNILVVDDNIPSAQTIGWMLELAGHNFTLAHKGGEVLGLAKRMNPDVIMLDIGLPDKDGYEVCRELRADGAFADTVMIAQTGWGQPKDRQLAKEAGFDHHMVKPIDFENLSDLLSSLSVTK